MVNGKVGQMNGNIKTYPYIRAWGRYLGSFNYYIEDQVALARAEDAPDDALYKASLTGRWVRFYECTNQHAVASVTYLIREMAL